MSDATRRDALRKVLEGNSWLPASSPDEDPEKTLDRALATLDEFAAEYERRFGERPDPFGLLADNPQKAKAFFQIDTFQVSLEMRIMIWRLLLGCEIQEVLFRYHADQEAELAVSLQTPDGEPEGPYRGRRFTDFRVLRHFGAGLREGKLALKGYYALK